MSEIVRAGITGIPKGQTEAAISTGSPRAGDVLHHPPAGAAEHDPVLREPVVSMIKDTSLAFIVG